MQVGRVWRSPQALRRAYTATLLLVQSSSTLRGMRFSRFLFCLLPALSGVAQAGAPRAGGRARAAQTREVRPPVAPEPGSATAPPAGEIYLAMDATKCLVVKSAFGTPDVAVMPGDAWASSCVLFADQLVCMSWMRDSKLTQLTTKQARWMSPYKLAGQADPGFLVFEGTEGQTGSLFLDFAHGRITGRFSYTTTRAVDQVVMHKHCAGTVTALEESDPRLDWWTEAKKKP